MLDKYSAVFNNEKDCVATLQVDPTVERKFYKVQNSFICNETEGRSRVGLPVGNRSN